MSLFSSLNEASTGFLNGFNGVGDDKTPEKNETPEKNDLKAPLGDAAFKVLTTPDLLTHIGSFNKMPNITRRIEGLTGNLTQTTYKVFSDALKIQLTNTDIVNSLSHVNPRLVLEILENYYSANSIRLMTQPRIIGESCNYEDVINDMVNWSSSESDITRLFNDVKRRDIYTQIINAVKMSEQNRDNGILPERVLPGHLLNLIYTFLKGQYYEGFRIRYAYIIFYETATAYDSLDKFAQDNNNGRAQMRSFTGIVHSLLPSLYKTFRSVFVIEGGKRRNKRHTKRGKSKAKALKKRTRKI